MSKKTFYFKRFYFNGNVYSFNVYAENIQEALKKVTNWALKKHNIPSKSFKKYHQYVQENLEKGEIIVEILPDSEEKQLKFNFEEKYNELYYGLFNESHDVNWDRKKGHGQTPNQADISYFGFTKEMSPEEFRRLVPSGNWDIKTVDFIKEEIKKNNPISPPFLITELRKIDDNIYLQVIDHEGRSRSDACKNLGVEKIPVDIFVKNYRARHISPEIKEAKLLHQK